MSKDTAPREAPKRTAKTPSADLDRIASMSVREQIDALAQALLREFMHRRGFTKTLQTFDRECPRSEGTIASRQLMRQLLELPSLAFPSRLVDGPSANGGAKKPPTLMAELCSYRLQKRAFHADRPAPTDDAKDASEAEMETWRLAAAARRQSIRAATKHAAEAKAKYESRLEAKRAKKRRLQSARRPVGSGWAPSGGPVPSFGLNGGGGQCAAERPPPAFFAGEGVNLMAERLPRGQCEEWRPSMPHTKPNVRRAGSPSPSAPNGGFGGGGSRTPTRSPSVGGGARVGGGYDQSARPAASAIRQGTGFRNAANGERERSGGRKERKVTILAD